MTRFQKIDSHTLGSALIYIGVAAWLPYFYLVSVGREVSILPFVIVHVLCVASGARLRGHAVSAGAQATKDARLRLLSRILITLGVLAWAPYFYLTRVLNVETEMTPFLIAHLSGVLPGVGLRIYLGIKK